MEIGWRLEPDGCLTGKTPASRSKPDTCDPLSYFGLQSVAAHIRVWCMQRCMVRCVHTFLPDERNRAAIMILAVGYLLVNWIIQSDKQRACTKATYQPLVKNSWRPREAGILLKDLAVTVIVFRETTRPVCATIINLSLSSDRARNHLQLPCRFSLKGSGIRKGRDTRRPTTSYQVGVK